MNKQENFFGNHKEINILKLVNMKKKGRIVIILNAYRGVEQSGSSSGL